MVSCVVNCDDAYRPPMGVMHNEDITVQRDRQSSATSSLIKHALACHDGPLNFFVKETLSGKNCPFEPLVTVLTVPRAVDVYERNQLV
ncbi:MAG: hypothetical protein QG577_1912 [Thermodesulfobacteriota bacterium]|nr:hypothetical protein [Thermodesulfobacteriota bacterium]